MDIVKIVAIAIVAAVAVLILRQYNNEMAVLVAIGSGVLILILVLDELFEVVYAFYNLAELTGINSGLFSVIIKIIGIGYLSEFGNSICVDANAKNLGDKLLLAGKVMILVTAMPVVLNLIETIIEIIP